MSETFTAACVQNDAGIDPDATTARAEELIREAAGRGADLICTPEFFSCLDTQLDGLETAPHPETQHPALPRFQALADELDVWLLLGSLAIIGDGDDERLCNRSFLIDAAGRIVQRYDKIHLFDIDLDKDEVYRESAQFQPGVEAALAPTPWGMLGMSVCYDLRFPYLYRDLAQAGASFLTVPAAFTKKTGEAHWHVLLRARAIETGCFVIAPCQSGVHGIGATFGHSLIVDPWGAVLADGGEDEGIVLAEIDTALVAKARRRIPALKHDRDYAGPMSPVELAAAGE
ncbi:MAG: carbon-nitrogen hydrolase family protein [Magnetovibrio sp.]|nr:carbon-nitrogen hydrolase family protein [Magnetovibrio sp.]